MMMFTSAIAFLFSLSVVAGAGEKVIMSFDGEKETIERMSEIIREASGEGCSVVRFPEGRWKWHDLTRMELPEKENLKREEFDAELVNLEASVREWMTKHTVNAVQITIDTGSRASVFFKIERILTEVGVPYALVTGMEVDRGRVLLAETGGWARVILPNDPTLQQDGAAPPTTAPESKAEGKAKPIQGAKVCPR